MAEVNIVMYDHSYNSYLVIKMSNKKQSSTSGNVNLKYRIKDDNQTICNKNYELLVIACDPRNLYNICDYTPTELCIFQKLINFTFHTSLLKVKVSSCQEHSVYFAPDPLGKMSGNVYAFRNESAKQFGLDVANKMTHNLVTVYQLAGSMSSLSTAEEFEKILKEQLPELSWWPFSDQYEIIETLTTPYFAHFSNEDLKNGLPWTLRDLQGENNTLYVHGFTCFESVLHCWSYAEMILNFVDRARDSLPKELDAPIVILGAGVSGLLFAVRLKKLGYTNIEILELSDRPRGKTLTIIQDGPYPSGSTEKTVCELGTCYLSPAYFPMTQELNEFLIDNNQIDFVKNDPNFRGIATEGEFPPDFQVAPIINYPEYVILKAKALLNFSQNDDETLVEKRIAFDLVRYCIFHWEIMGEQRPMPLEPPKHLLEQTFYEFLQNNDLLSLVGMMEYIYEVQGYGTMESIPAYYGLIWITPIVMQTILLDNLGAENRPVVTAWEKGWGDLWDQIVEKENLNIIYSVETTFIKRGQ